jgi:hypothetical protein
MIGPLRDHFGGGARSQLLESCERRLAPNGPIASSLENAADQMMETSSE